MNVLLHRQPPYLVRQIARPLCILFLGAYRGEEVVARAFAATAGLSADAAVLVVLGVPLTFLATRATGRGTGLDRCAEHADIGRGLAGKDATRGVACVGAVVVEANAADQVLHVLLAETGVGATGACGGTVEALVDAAQQRVSTEACRLWMRRDHFSNCHFLSLPVRAASDPHV